MQTQQERANINFENALNALNDDFEHICSRTLLEAYLNARMRMYNAEAYIKRFFDASGNLKHNEADLDIAAYIKAK